MMAGGERYREPSRWRRERA